MTEYKLSIEQTIDGVPVRSMTHSLTDADDMMDGDDTRGALLYYAMHWLQADGEDDEMFSLSRMIFLLGRRDSSLSTYIKIAKAFELWRRSSGEFNFKDCVAVTVDMDKLKPSPDD